MSLSAPKQRRLSLLGGGVALVVAVALIAYGLYGLWQRWAVTSNPDPKVAIEVASTSTVTSDETLPPPEACLPCSVSADQLRKIIIEPLAIDGCIERVGVDQHGAIAVPTNIYFAGWYVNSALPAEKGLSIIDGHVLGRYNDAIFARLAEIINIEMGEGGKIQQFEASDIRTSTTEEANRHLYEKLPDVERQLTLITCIGTYDRQANTYDKRVIVRAELKAGVIVD